MCPIKECHCAGHSRSSRLDSSTLRFCGCSPSDWVWKGLCVHKLQYNCTSLLNGFYDILQTSFCHTKDAKNQTMHLGEFLRWKNCMEKKKTCWVKYSTSGLFWWAISRWWAEKLPNYQGLTTNNHASVCRSAYQSVHLMKYSYWWGKKSPQNKFD